MEISLSKIKVRVGSDNRTLFKIPSLKISEGEKILIRGASGKGKTTFLHLLAGLFLPAEGHVSVGNTTLTKLNEEQRCQFRRQYFGIVFQKLNLIEHLTAIENVQLCLKDQGDYDKAEEALAAVGLMGRENDRTSVLSLGEQQRVAVARVLAGEPEIVFADEPTSSLDEKNANEIMQLLLKTCENKTLIVVSHDHRIEKYFKNIQNFEAMTE